MRRPLDGVTVVALEQVIAGPFCTRQLAELGARVIKIERPEGGDQSRSMDRTVQGLSSHFVWTNRSKESLALDVKHPRAREILARLLARADVFVQNLAPGAVERLGLGAAELRARHPQLIWCGISGYGTSGPYAEKRAYDLLVQCEAGLLSVTGTPEAPAKAGIPVADIAAGMYAMSSILAALLRRERDGVGATLDITMFEALGEWMGFPAYFANYGGSPPPRSGAYHATIVPYGPFRAGDGKTVFLSIQNEREFARFCEQVLGRAALVGDPRFSSSPARMANREAMHAEIEAVFGTLTAAQVEERLEAAGIANARLNTLQEFWDHPQLAARDRWREVGTSAGAVRAAQPPFNLSEFEPRMDDVPALGAHSRSLLKELGYAAGEIDALAAAGAVRTS
ncbi:MAG: CoA transferase [Betaproteobacteria bacterium]|nr:CoA transferase [Betaproteobacteria bacterium]MDH5220244.1 CoA transferase [Betaproteobacteria bacterium]MDH5352620.1 CoA transferase [Betaproteobacteria bacterium]